VARKHALKLRELRRIRGRFLFILAGMAVVTLLILTHIGIQVASIKPEGFRYLDFLAMCLYGSAAVVMTIAQIAFLRRLTVGEGRRLEEMAYTDELTGLGNRRHAAKFLAEEFHEAQLGKNALSLFLLDLDDFKPVNDTYGHQAGDLVLRAVAHALTASVRASDFVGRIGGDEFLVVLPDTDSQCASVVAHRVADRLRGITVTPGEDESRTIERLTASVGISSYPANAGSRRGLVEDADRAMYAAKRSGKGHILISIARPAGPEARASAGRITALVGHIDQIMDRARAAARPEESHDV